MTEGLFSNKDLILKTPASVAYFDLTAINQLVVNMVIMQYKTRHFSCPIMPI